jgi:GDP-L-fucose synthase
MRKKIMVTGGAGMIGSVLMRVLRARGYGRIITRSHSDLDLIDQKAVNDFFRNEKIDMVLMLAAKVAGIFASKT